MTTTEDINEIESLPTTSDPLLEKAKLLIAEAWIGQLEEIFALVSELNFAAVDYMRIARTLKYNYDITRGKKWLEVKQTPRAKDWKNHTDKECDVISKDHAIEKFGSFELRDQIGWGYIRIADQLRDKGIRLQAIDKQQRQNTEFN